MEKRIAICPGSFDPITKGHLDIIRRASGLFDEVIVLILVNYAKSNTAFTPAERVELARRVTKDLPNVRVDFFGGLLADYASHVGACTLIKGLRAVSDFEYEFQMALTNKKLCPTLETMFMTTDIQYMYLSSSIVREVATMGGDISDLSARRSSTTFAAVSGPRTTRAKKTNKQKRKKAALCPVFRQRAAFGLCCLPWGDYSRIWSMKPPPRTRPPP